MLGERIADLDLPAQPMRDTHVCVKEAVLPFGRFLGADSLLGPRCARPARLWALRPTFRPRSRKPRPRPLGTAARGTAFITVTDADKPAGAGLAAQLHDLDFRIVATRGTAQAIERMGSRDRAQQGRRSSPHVVDWIARGDVDLVINTPTGSGARSDGWEIRRAAHTRGIPAITTLAGARRRPARSARRARREPAVVSLQDLHGR